VIAEAAADGAGADAAEDASFMALALALAGRGLGRTWPNPTVGCVVVRDGRVVGRGWTQPGGRPHAETEALGRAGAAARGATLYASLEPCIHHGGTPPCVDAILRAGIGRVVVACEDPDPRVSGRGLAALRAAGLPVATGLAAAAAIHLNQGFFLRITRQRPLFTLKLATSLDGRIATGAGDSRWITGSAARARAHLLRAQHDAVLVGGETARVDDPDLGCRLPGLGQAAPVRLVADSRGRLPPTSRLVTTAGERPTWLLTLAAVPELAARGVRVLAVDKGGDGHIDPQAMARRLADEGLTRVLVEGGGLLARALLAADLIDRLVWFHAPLIIGGDGRPAVAAADGGIERLSEAFRFVRTAVEPVGDDVIETYERAAPLAAGAN
jgi:diaminohydroxyphosphoribosylaminopyrimidine deaminase/5-amino-6-(5-phosphoribosylamino)uracil reductase